MSTQNPNPQDDMDNPLLPEISALPPPSTPLHGHHTTLRPLTPNDATELYKTLGGTSHASLWTFFPDGPYLTLTSFDSSITNKSQSTDPTFFTVIDTTTNTAVGHAAFMRISIPHRTVELGHIIFSGTVHRSSLTTETIYLMLKRVFDELGFRRCEWKCDDRNTPSKRAAVRFGFSFEGVFKQHMLVKGRNRDTAWFAMLDCDWPGVKAGFERWLDSSNFDDAGRQRRGLVRCREEEGVVR